MGEYDSGVEPRKWAGLGLTVLGLTIAAIFAGGGSYLLYYALTSNLATTISNTGTGLLSTTLSGITSQTAIGLAITCIVIGIGIAAALILHPILRSKYQKNQDKETNKELHQRSLEDELESARSAARALQAQQEREKLLANTNSKKSSKSSTPESSDQEEESSEDTAHLQHKMV